MRRALLSGLAVLVAAPVLAAAPVFADDTATPAGPAATPSFGGYSTTVSATPLKVDIYEQSIPIPASPQLEFSLDYTKVLADAASSKARASYLWPGDSVGDGLSTILTALGLPQQLVDAVAANGYPIAATATQPEGSPTVAQEPVPGIQQRASAAPESSTAVAGLDTDCGEDCTLPAALAGVVEVGAARSRSQAAIQDAAAVGEADARIGQVSLAGGLITIDGVRATTQVVNDGTTITTTALSRITGLSVAGQELGIDADGVRILGTPVGSLPVAPAALTAALARLGITITAPVTEKSQDAGIGTAAAHGLVLDLDLAVLKRTLSPIIPFGQLSDLIAGLPDGLGPVKEALSTLTGLAPRLVFTFGTATSSVGTAAALPTTPTTDPATPPAGDDGTGGAVPTTGGGQATAAVGDVPVTDVPAADAAPSSSTEASAVAPAADTPGLPPMGSIPFLLMVLGLAGAASGGALLRRLGLAALGTGASCSGGLARGVPDLRTLVAATTTRPASLRGETP